MSALSTLLPRYPRAVGTLALLALVAVILVGCSTKGDQPKTAPPAGVRENGVLVLTRADNNRIAELRAGERLEVRLPENPTTGYAWAVDETDRRLLALDNTRYAPPELGSIGARGQRILIFTARQPGEVALKLKYWRIWEGDASVTERFAITVRIVE